MVSAENKPKKNRKPEKKNLLEAWDGCDNGPKDDMFCGHHKVKQQVTQKCRYLDEKNIMVSHHLLSDPLNFDPEERDVVGEPDPSRDACRDNVPAARSAALQADPGSLSRTVPDTASVPTNASNITDPMVHQRNISYDLSPAQTRISDLKRRLPSIRWAPAAYGLQVTEEPARWRCKGLASLKHEAGPPESPHTWKRAFGGRLEQSHARLAGSDCQPPSSGPSGVPTGAVIQRASGGLVAKSTGLLCEHHSSSFPPLQAQTQAQRSHVHSALREAARYGRKPGRADGHVFHRKLGDIPTGCSNASVLLDTLYRSGCQGDSELSTISHDVTLLHILQVLQSKPVSLPEVRGPRVYSI